MSKAKIKIGIANIKYCILIKTVKAEKSPNKIKYFVLEFFIKPFQKKNRAVKRKKVAGISVNNLPVKNIKIQDKAIGRDVSNAVFLSNISLINK